MITVNVVLPDGSCGFVSVLSHARLWDLKCAVYYYVCGIDPTLQVAEDYFGNALLGDTNTLENCGIRGGSTVWVWAQVPTACYYQAASFSDYQAPSFASNQMFVRTIGGKTIAINGASPQSSVGEVKEIIAWKDGTPPKMQKLTYGGKILANPTLLLADYNVPRESTLTLLLNLNGGTGEDNAMLVAAAAADIGPTSAASLLLASCIHPSPLVSFSGKAICGGVDDAPPTLTTAKRGAKEPGAVGSAVPLKRQKVAATEVDVEDDSSSSDEDLSSSDDDLSSDEKVLPATLLDLADGETGAKVPIEKVNATIVLNLNNGNKTFFEHDLYRHCAANKTTVIPGKFVAVKLNNGFEMKGLLLGVPHVHHAAGQIRFQLGPDYNEDACRLLKLFSFVVMSLTGANFYDTRMGYPLQVEDCDSQAKKLAVLLACKVEAITVPLEWLDKNASEYAQVKSVNYGLLSALVIALRGGRIKAAMGYYGSHPERFMHDVANLLKVPGGLNRRIVAVKPESSSDLCNVTDLETYKSPVCSLSVNSCESATVELAAGFALQGRWMDSAWKEGYVEYQGQPNVLTFKDSPCLTKEEFAASTFAVPHHKITSAFLFADTAIESSKRVTRGGNCHFVCFVYRTQENNIFIAGPCGRELREIEATSMKDAIVVAVRSKKWSCFCVAAVAVKADEEIVGELFGGGAVAQEGGGASADAAVAQQKKAKRKRGRKKNHFPKSGTFNAWHGPERRKKSKCARKPPEDFDGRLKIPGCLVVSGAATESGVCAAVCLPAVKTLRVPKGNGEPRFDLVRVNPTNGTFILESANSDDDLHKHLDSQKIAPASVRYSGHLCDCEGRCSCSKPLVPFQGATTVREACEAATTGGKNAILVIALDGGNETKFHVRFRANMVETTTFAAWYGFDMRRCDSGAEHQTLSKMARNVSATFKHGNATLKQNVTLILKANLADGADTIVTAASIRFSSLKDCGASSFLPDGIDVAVVSIYPHCPQSFLAGVKLVATISCSDSALCVYSFTDGSDAFTSGKIVYAVDGTTCGDHSFDCRRLIPVRVCEEEAEPSVEWPIHVRDGALCGSFFPEGAGAAKVVRIAAEAATFGGGIGDATAEGGGAAQPSYFVVRGDPLQSGTTVPVTQAERREMALASATPETKAAPSAFNAKAMMARPVLFLTTGTPAVPAMTTTAMGNKKLPTVEMTARAVQGVAIPPNAKRGVTRAEFGTIRSKVPTNVRATVAPYILGSPSSFEAGGRTLWPFMTSGDGGTTTFRITCMGVKSTVTVPSQEATSLWNKYIAARRRVRALLYELGPYGPPEGETVMAVFAKPGDTVRYEEEEKTVESVTSENNQCKLKFEEEATLVAADQCLITTGSRTAFVAKNPNIEVGAVHSLVTLTTEDGQITYSAAKDLVIGKCSVPTRHDMEMNDIALMPEIPVLEAMKLVTSKALGVFGDKNASVLTRNFTTAAGSDVMWEPTKDALGAAAAVHDFARAVDERVSARLAHMRKHYNLTVKKLKTERVELESAYAAAKNKVSSVATLFEDKTSDAAESGGAAESGARNATVEREEAKLTAVKERGAILVNAIKEIEQAAKDARNVDGWNKSDICVDTWMFIEDKREKSWALKCSARNYWQDDQLNKHTDNERRKLRLCSSCQTQKTMCVKATKANKELQKELRGFQELTGKPDKQILSLEKISKAVLEFIEKHAEAVMYHGELYDKLEVLEEALLGCGEDAFKECAIEMHTVKHRIQTVKEQEAAMTKAREKWSG